MSRIPQSSKGGAASTALAILLELASAIQIGLNVGMMAALTNLTAVLLREHFASAATFLRIKSRSLNPWKEQRAPTVLLLSFFAVARCSAAVTLLVEDPYGTFGAYNPTGHAAVFLDHVCAESYTKLRHCSAGESGIVLSRYLRVHGNDWLAVPLVPYLYAVDDLQDAPQSVSRSEVDALRERYWAAHLQQLAPAELDGKAPRGVKCGLWVGLVGASYDRTIHGYQIESTWEQDEALIQALNSAQNVAKYNLLFHNCADFAKTILGFYAPIKVHRNFIGDLGVLTPKRVGAAFVHYGKHHDDSHFTLFTIPQVSGTMPRSYAMNGVAESLVKSKRYIIPLILLNPTFALAATVGYLTEAHARLPKDAPVVDLRQLAGEPTVDLQRLSITSAGGVEFRALESRVISEKEAGS